MVVHLNVHSAFSLLEGMPLPAELVRAASVSGMTALALTDHLLLTGTVPFVEACQAAGIQPIAGLEVDIESRARLVLLAAGLEGWANLCRISSRLALEPAEGGASLSLLSAHRDDLIALAGEELGLEKLGALKEIYPGRLYLQLRDPAAGMLTGHMARRAGLPMAAVHPIFMLTPEQAELQRTLTAIRLNQPLSRLAPGDPAPVGSHFLSSREMEARFKLFPAALAATEEIAARCRFDFPLGIPHMPTVPLPPGQTAAQALRERAEAGAKRLYGTMKPEIQTRLDHELTVIAQMGFEPIFLIVEEILRFARQSGVPFSSRGSAASSLVAHCLGITSPDPLKLNLYMERFLNPARLTPPDIDTDLCSLRRDSVIEHVFDTYGRERVAMVATVHHFRPRSALSDAGKAFGLAPAQIRELTEQLPHAFWARRNQNEEGLSDPAVFNGLRAKHPEPRMQKLFDQAEALMKLPRHLSMHPGGVVVAPGPITDLVPVMPSGSKDVTLTQFDLSAVEALGLVKIDLLGIRGLTVLGDVAKFIHEGQPLVYRDALAVLDSTPLDDPATSQRIENGLTIGCFQIESPGMRATLREIHARSADDIMAALALYRPGPLTGGLKDAFVRRFKREEPVVHLHPALAPLLDETFGVILYQEQVLRIAHELAGFSLAEADLLRRAMSHFDPGKRMQELRRKFIQEAQARSGIPPETGERVWEMMAAFAGYGFPKAHAASYAQVAWRSAWCKTHFPAEFMAAVLANWGGYYSQRVYLSEARRLGLKVRPPHVNYSGRHFIVCREPQALFMGLDQVKNLTRRTFERIIQYRPYHSLDHFLSQVDPRPQELESLAMAGALDGLGKIPAIIRRARGGGWQAGQLSLFAWADENEADWTLEQKMRGQQAVLGISVEVHPLELAAAQIRQRGAISLQEATEQMGRRVTVAGVRQTSHRGKTAKGEAMLFLTLEDLAGMMDVVIFPDLYRQVRNLIHTSAPLLVSGRMEMDSARGEPYLRAERVVEIHLP
ncbi:MAG TPA: DNA polymerase III subunit alpha [Anaerolineaceae bacterium]|nr:DNA polymerase III subunit alpha [Anaerolineaceae bacterium]HPN53159.1 DNA polymerase III subunit alpha [Anaerolineaceae bacterium]